MDNKNALVKMLLACIWLFILAIWPFTTQAECRDLFQKKEASETPFSAESTEALRNMQTENHNAFFKRRNNTNRQQTVLHGLEFFDFYY